MATPYYTDDMRAFVKELSNPYEFQVTISQMLDDDGPFLCLAFCSNDYLKYERPQLEVIARYLVDLKEGLESHGARVTFLITEE